MKLCFCLHFEILTSSFFFKTKQKTNPSINQIGPFFGSFPEYSTLQFCFISPFNISYFCKFVKYYHCIFSWQLSFKWKYKWRKEGRGGINLIWLNLLWISGLRKSWHSDMLSKSVCEVLWYCKISCFHNWICSSLVEATGCSLDC